MNFTKSVKKMFEIYFIVACIIFVITSALTIQFSLNEFVESDLFGMSCLFLLYAFISFIWGVILLILCYALIFKPSLVSKK